MISNKTTGEFWVVINQYVEACGGTPMLRLGDESWGSSVTNIEKSLAKIEKEILLQAIQTITKAIHGQIGIHI